MLSVVPPHTMQPSGRPVRCAASGVTGATGAPGATTTSGSRDANGFLQQGAGGSSGRGCNGSLVAVAPAEAAAHRKEERQHRVVRPLPCTRPTWSASQSG